MALHKGEQVCCDISVTWDSISSYGFTLCVNGGRKRFKQFTQEWFISSLEFLFFFSFAYSSTRYDWPETSHLTFFKSQLSLEQVQMKNTIQPHNDRRRMAWKTAPENHVLKTFKPVAFCNLLYMSACIYCAHVCVCLYVCVCVCVCDTGSG